MEEVVLGILPRDPARVQTLIHFKSDKLVLYNRKYFQKIPEIESNLSALTR